MLKTIGAAVSACLLSTGAFAQGEMVVGQYRYWTLLSDTRDRCELYTYNFPAKIQFVNSPSQELVSFNILLEEFPFSTSTQRVDVDLEFDNGDVVRTFFLSARSSDEQAYFDGELGSTYGGDQNQDLLDEIGAILRSFGESTSVDIYIEDLPVFSVPIYGFRDALEEFVDCETYLFLAD